MKRMTHEKTRNTVVRNNTFLFCGLLALWFVQSGCDADKSTRQEGDFTEELNELNLEMVYIQGGEFEMGSPQGDMLAYEDEFPRHKITLSPFHIGRFEVTQAQWTKVMQDNPSHFTGCDTCPVESVSYADALTFIDKLNELTGKSYRLPTEAEWEYACRAGSNSIYYFGDDESRTAEHSWSAENSGGKTSPVGQKAPNAWNLYDMYGNVEEWCQDRFQSDYYASSPSSNPLNGEAALHPLFVNRGGSFKDPGWLFRSSYRMWNMPDYRFDGLGFRLALSTASE